VQRSGWAWSVQWECTGAAVRADGADFIPVRWRVLRRLEASSGRGRWRRSPCARVEVMGRRLERSPLRGVGGGLLMVGETGKRRGEVRRLVRHGGRKGGGLVCHDAKEGEWGGR
jgi:hypothetical protein